MIQPHELAALHPLLRLRPLRWLLFRWLGLPALNKTYTSLAQLPPRDFLRAFLTQQEVVYRFHEKDAARIPKSGPFIVACNHPLGALDGLILLEIIQTVRPDVKIMGHQLLERIQPLQPYLLPVNPMEGRTSHPAASLRGLRGALDWLANGHAVVVFPAAEVSRFQWKTQKIEDRPNPDGVLRFLEKANVPVLPAHFFGRNSWGFYLASALLRPLSTGLLVREALRPARKPYEIRLGKPFTFENGPNLRQRIYRLQKSKRYLKTLWQTVFLPPKTQDPVAPLPDPTELATAVQRHLSRVAPLVAQSNLVVFVAHGDEIPGLLETVGSLRETAFRGVGEGTGLPLDVDRFDATYHHLILWNTELKCVWGAYRLGLGHELLAQYGKQGLYLHAFYRIKKELLPFLHQTVEMGRAFVVPEAQQKPLPLYLLWRGILAFAAQDPASRRYLMGSVSVSNAYSKHAQRFLLAFVQTHFWDHHWAAYLKPRKPFLLRLTSSDRAYLEQSTPLDLKSFDRLLEEIEPGGTKLPILLKKYLGQNARALAFNRDPDFNTVDALLYVDVQSLPPDPFH